MRMERLLRQFIQDYLMSTWSCLLLVLVFALSIVLLFYWESSLEYFRRMPSPIPSLMSLWSLWRSIRRPNTSCQMISSMSFPSSPHAPRIKYDIFINFRGLDTRRGFLSHLLEALSHAKIEAFVDYELMEGDELSSALFTAIEESQIALIIFSNDYASSPWCLQELVKITECRVDHGQIVVPIFYNIDPSDVRHQKGCYENAFAKQEKRFKDNITNVWRKTLREVANLSGFDSKNFGTEAELIKEVVKRVLKRFERMPVVDFKSLVGIDKPIEDLRSLIFCNGSKDVCVIGIWGVGGIGKTTIASALFNIMSSEFEDCYFLANVREQSKAHGIIKLRDELLSTLLEEKDLKIGTSLVPTHVLRRLQRKKVLVVLDGVTNPDEVIDLIGGCDWLGPGSRIIVTTRNKDVICDGRANGTYKVELLGSQEALKLLSLHAFNNENHLEHSHELMMKVIEYAKGLPLALKVLGIFLRGKNAEEWESQLQKLQKMPDPSIQAVLRVSYEELDREVKSIFLYIACFFNRDDKKNEVQALLEACGYRMPIAWRILQDKALIEVSRYGNVSMHDLIREMGQEIVREQNIQEPWKRNHLWDPDDIYCALNQDEGTERIESITLDISRVSDLRLNPQSFARMVNLKLLRFYKPYPYGTRSGVHLPEEGLEILSNNLRLFHWDRYPSKSLPATFKAENLVELCMPGSHVERLWDGAQPQNLANLKKIDLQGSELVELPDFSKASSLKYIYLDSCMNLLSIHPSIFCLQRLEMVTLKWCVGLEELPDIEALPSSDRFCSTLNYLDIQGCESLKHLPDSLSKLRSLSILALEDCIQLDTSNLQNILDGLSALVWLKLDRCHNLFELPENISKLSSLEHLFLEETSIKSLPKSIKHLPRLAHLYLSNCKRLQSIPEIPASLFYLGATGCTSLERLFTPTPELLEEHIRIKHITLTSDRGLPGRTTFLFHNCPNLDKDALQAVRAYVRWSNLS